MPHKSATHVYHWTKASISSINRYREILGELLITLLFLWEPFVFTLLAVNI